MGSLGHPPTSTVSIEQKYAQERDKRIRSDGLGQYADVRDLEKYKHLADDPWCHETGDRQWQVPAILREGRCRAVIVGTGYGGLTYAAHLLMATSLKPTDILFIDNAAGFGGAWYWNRYPGLMCDVEAACYMPLLEATGYVPKHRYAYGPELRGYAELLASHFGLQSSASWRTTVQDAHWVDDASEWRLTVSKKQKDGSTASYSVTADFVVLTAGLLHNPKLPKLPGIEKYRGHSFHTARWDYRYTGGSPEDPTLENLRDKKVMFVGTGATAVQAIPQLARWAKELSVVQRTPAAVDVRGQYAIDPVGFQKNCSTQKGWQRLRRENMAAWVSDTIPKLNLVADGWTTFPSYSAAVGGPKARDTRIPANDYVKNLHAIDLPRQEKIRARVDSIVKNPKTAESLKPWYDGWCKRPCFHDDYLETFNQDNVRLIDTKGRGIASFTETGIIFEDQHYEADVVVWGTGFEPWTAGSPSQRAGFTITGRNGLTMDQKWEGGIGTLHGMLTSGFPNLIISGVNQTGTTVNYAHMADVMANHAAQIISIAEKRRRPTQSEAKFVIEPTLEAEEEWFQRLLSMAHAYGGFAGCTPSYATNEGQVGATTTPEEALKMAKGLNWGAGILDFIDVIEDWRADGNLTGLDVQILDP